MTKISRAGKQQRSRSQRRSAGFFLSAALFICCFAALAGCAGPQTTRLTVDDFEAMTAAMAQSLLQSDAFAKRRPDDEPWIVSIQKVTNLSSDVIPQREQWAIMAQLQGAMPIQTLWSQKNVRFVLPAQRVVELRESGIEYGESFGEDRRPTHVMTATFRSVTRAQDRDRTDVYYTEFEIIDLRSGEPVWQDRFEFKRAARGHLWD